MSIIETALIIVLIFTAALAVYLLIARRQDKHEANVKVRLDTFVMPIIKPDMRVDELVKFVSTLRGAEALKSLGVNNGRSN
jgi:hypothetical protein